MGDVMPCGSARSDLIPDLDLVELLILLSDHYFDGLGTTFFIPFHSDAEDNAKKIDCQACWDQELYSSLELCTFNLSARIPRSRNEAFELRTPKVVTSSMQYSSRSQMPLSIPSATPDA